MKTDFLLSLQKLCWIRFSIVAFALVTLAQPVLAQDPFSEHIRTTDPLTADQQQKSFTVPEGLVVDLIASEPEIQKPLNMAFDAKGQLWVTTTTEYPYPAEEGEGRDQIVVLKDTDGDGSFETRTVFADDLNIPIGVLPYGQGCIAFDIPNIRYLIDSDGDGVCDEKKLLYGPFDYSRDTHGLNNSFRMGFDGWIYACHGFNNQSKVTGRDGNQVQLNSGNTYRFRPDGSRIEHFSHGQVNPFGMVIDSWFRIFTADCHSKPLTNVVRNGYYPSFGAPHDGLGFAPSMMQHLHGSTAIAGLAIVPDSGWPEELSGQLISGNVMTCRLNRNQLRLDGATVQAVEQPDLLKTTDPWFRPVDIVCGPDGALYVADFYNRIIGHYEVPLEHPGRDRQRGRIWRIRPAQDDVGQQASNGSRNERSSPLNSTNSVNAALAVLNRRCFEGQAVAEESVAELESLSPLEAVCLLWQIARVIPERLDLELLRRFGNSKSPLVHSHLMRLLSEVQPVDASGDTSQDDGEKVPIAKLPIEEDDFLRFILIGLEHSDAVVRQNAIEAAGRSPNSLFVPVLVNLANADQDPLTAYVARIALKQHMLRGPGSDNIGAEIWAWVNSDQWSPQQLRTLQEVALAVNQPYAASFVLASLKRTGGNAVEDRFMTYLSQNLPAEEMDRWVEQLDPALSREKQEVINLLQALAEGVKRGGGKMPDRLRQWAGNVTLELLREVQEQEISWSSFTLDRNSEPLPTADPWKKQFRQSTDGKTLWMLSSIMRGEERTGVLRSPAIRLQDGIQFQLAGHRGYPDQPEHELNRVQLRLIDTGEVVHVAFPPRSDVATLIAWDTTNWSGKEAWIELIDGDTGGAYAWLAASDFAILHNAELEWLKLPNLLPGDRLEQLATISQLSDTFDLGDVLGADLALESRKNESLRYQLTRLWLRHRWLGNSFLADLAQRNATSELNLAGLSLWLQFIKEWDHSTDADKPNVLQNLVAKLPADQQRVLVRASIQNGEVFQEVLELARVGKMSQSVFAERDVLQAIQLKQPRQLADVKELIANLPPVDQQWRELTEQRASEFRELLGQLEANGETAIQADTGSDGKSMSSDGWQAMGKKTFEQNCSVCHQISGKGQVVGPQLDGIGRRGLDRVLEDVLLPNENVDHAFRSQLIQLIDGRLITGLVRQQTDQAIELVDKAGKVLTIDVDDVEGQRQSPLSLMPEDVARKLTEEQLFGLVHFLLTEGKGETAK